MDSEQITAALDRFSASIASLVKTLDLTRAEQREATKELKQIDRRRARQMWVIVTVGVCLLLMTGGLLLIGRSVVATQRSIEKVTSAEAQERTRLLIRDLVQEMDCRGYRLANGLPPLPPLELDGLTCADQTPRAVYPVPTTVEVEGDD